MKRNKYKKGQWRSFRCHDEQYSYSFPKYPIMWEVMRLLTLKARRGRSLFSLIVLRGMFAYVALKKIWVAKVTINLMWTLMFFYLCGNCTKIIFVSCCVSWFEILQMELLKKGILLLLCESLIVTFRSNNESFQHGKKMRCFWRSVIAKTVVIRFLSLNWCEKYQR